MKLQQSVLPILILGTILGRIESRKLVSNLQSQIEGSSATSKSSVSLKPRPHNSPDFTPGSSHSNATTLTFTPQSPLKGITDLILYAARRDAAVESRTGLVLFGLITALELFVGTTLFVGVTGAVVLGLVLMVKLMSIGGIIMIG